MANEEKGFQKNNIHWYPGHMAKTRREISEKLNLIDIIYEVIDARMPRSSKIVDIDDLIKNKPRLLIMTKYDLCDKNETNKFIKYYEELGYQVIPVDLMTGTNVSKIIDASEVVLKEENEKRKSKGLKPRNIRALILGIPNAGKSTLIKTIAGLWPYAQGQIEVPEGQRLFLAQKPYLPQGTLAQAAVYPQVQADIKQVAHYFKLLGLEHLIPMLEKDDQWYHILSLGEQQRVAFVRALIIKPKLLILDEATSAMDEKLEKTAYDLILSECKETILVSVGHRSTLKALHHLELKPSEQGSTLWKVEVLNP